MLENQIPRIPGAECPGMNKRKDPQKNRPCAIFVGERVKKKGSCGGFPNLRTYEIEDAILQLDAPTRDVLRFLIAHGLKWRGYVICGSVWECPFSFSLFSLFFLFLGSWLPQINLLSPESAPRAFSRISIPSLYEPRDSLHTLRHAVLSLGRTERRMDTLPT